MLPFNSRKHGVLLIAATQQLFNNRFSNKDESTAGIFISTGTVSNSSSMNHKKGTFVLRNGGYS